MGVGQMVMLWVGDGRRWVEKCRFYPFTNTRGGHERFAVVEPEHAYWRLWALNHGLLSDQRCANFSCRAFFRTGMDNFQEQT